MTRQEAGRKGGQTTAARHGSEHMRAIGRRGGLATVARRGRGYMSTIGGRGFEATVKRYWQGDKEAFAAWLTRMGQWATDPMPGNGYVRHPGPWPAPAPITCRECGQDRPNSSEDCPRCRALDNVPF